MNTSVAIRVDQNLDVQAGQPARQTDNAKKEKARLTKVLDVISICLLVGIFLVRSHWFYRQ